VAIMGYPSSVDFPLAIVSEKKFKKQIEL